MKIGIDLDGVVIDSVRLFNVYEEIYDIDVLNGNNLINKQQVDFQDKYNWTEKQKKVFIEKYFLKVAKENKLMPGFKEVYNRLKKEGHEFIVITARGNPVKELKDESLKLFKENNIEFDKYYWGVTDKSEICKKENIELMIEDNYNWIKKLVEDKLKILYFRDVNMTKVKESEYLTEVNNWGDIYRYFNKIKNK